MKCDCGLEMIDGVCPVRGKDAQGIRETWLSGIGQLSAIDAALWHAALKGCRAGLEEGAKACESYELFHQAAEEYAAASCHREDAQAIRSLSTAPDLEEKIKKVIENE